MNPSKSCIVQGALLALLGAANSASHAAITVYTAPMNFVGVPNLVDTYDNAPAGFASGPIVRFVPPLGYTVGASGGLYFVGSASDRWLSTNVAGQTVLFNAFGASVTTAGGYFFGTDLSGTFVPGKTVTVTATDSFGASATQTLTAQTRVRNDLTQSYVLFASNGRLVSLTAAIEDSDLFLAVNNFVTAIPEPASSAMLLAGLGILSMTVRGQGRRRLY